jgi:hypothetical protein
VELDVGAKVGDNAWSSPVPQRRRCRRYPSGGTTLGEHLREAARVALGEHLRKAVRAALGEHLCNEQLVSMVACSTSTPCSTPGEWPAADEHPLPSEHEQASS